MVNYFSSPLLHQISTGDSLHRPQPRSATFHCNSPLPFSLHCRTRSARIRRPPAAQDHSHAWLFAACVVEPFYTALEDVDVEKQQRPYLSNLGEYLTGSG
ncbi:uncharacterized protein LOC131016731 isoform X4 [Salvia miltiorrhiza]|uniref:uncharacterized protein LOC131016731 isoform X4 n=1 Tax=Salvia miltiorrhiza TaxID=226208 RepID=UPI0025AC5500|nr:uncharacterized protein LOC131016731 isoform X4 [Salvia miltiorrhiza]